MKQVKLKQKPFDRKLFVVTLILSIIGLIVISSASVVLSFQRFGRTSYYLERQLAFVVVGVICMLILSRIDYHWFKRYSHLLLLVALGLLAAVLVPHIGFKVGNARRWINLGFSLLQPSEFAKLALIFYLSAWFDVRKESVKYFSGLISPLLVTGLVAALIIIEPDFGSMTAILLIAASIFFAGGARLAHLAYLFISGLGVGWLAVQAAPYRMERVLTFLNPSSDPLGAGYQINQAILAIGSGGLWGQGFGESRQKFNYLPEPIGDSVFAVMAEELGFLRILVVLIIFILFALFGFAIAKRAPDAFGRNVAIGVTMWVIIQAGVNIGAIAGILPLTGITLPFISYGGSSVLALSAGIGVLLNISRQKV